MARVNRKIKNVTNCSKMTVNYMVMYCNTLHYTVEYTATHCSAGDTATLENCAIMKNANSAKRAA